MSMYTLNALTSIKQMWKINAGPFYPNFFKMKLGI